MKLAVILIVVLFACGYLSSYLIARNKNRQFLSERYRATIRRFGMTCFMAALVIILLVLYIRIRH